MSRRELTILHNQITREIEAAEDQPLVIDNGAWPEIAAPYRDYPNSAFKSDFDQILDDQAVSQIGPDGQHLDELDSRFARDQIKKDRDNQEAPSRSINPPSWNRGSLGDGVTLAAPGAVEDNSLGNGPATSIVFWPGEDRETIPVTITVMPRLPFDTSKKFKPYINIRWGTQSGQFSMDVDLGTGFTVMLNASSVYVTGYLASGSTGNLFVSGSIGFYAAQKTTTCTYTSTLSAAINTPTTVIRPSFATTIQCFERQNVADQWLLSFQDSNSNELAQRLVPANNYIESPLSLPNNCAQVVVTNQGGAGTNAYIVWGLM